mmetsp:Transcript_28378/g.52363  ORF Transcript_28378/g.52363 Transcript_28378/m.52363 type:complete len:274 (+) Transcript_28378:164-985(+)
MFKHWIISPIVAAWLTATIVSGKVERLRRPDSNIVTRTSNFQKLAKDVQTGTRKSNFRKHAQRQAKKEKAMSVPTTTTTTTTIPFPAFDARATDWWSSSSSSSSSSSDDNTEVSIIVLVTEDANDRDQCMAVVSNFNDGDVCDEWDLSSDVTFDNTICPTLFQRELKKGKKSSSSSSSSRDCDDGKFIIIIVDKDRGDSCDKEIFRLHQNMKKEWDDGDIDDLPDVTVMVVSPADCTSSDNLEKMVSVESRNGYRIFKSHQQHQSWEYETIGV